MKTPREILFGRHRTAEPHLDFVRRAVMEELSHRKMERPNRFLVALLWCPRKFWSELIWPARRIWAGFAAAWLVIVIGNLADGPDRALLEAGTKPPRAQVLMAWQQQQKLLASLLNEMDSQAAEKPKSATRPRSDRWLVTPVG